MKQVKVSIHKGKVSADFSGFVGKACEAMAKEIEPEGFNVEDKSLKPEYHYDTGSNTQHNKETY